MSSSSLYQTLEIDSWLTPSAPPIPNSPLPKVGEPAPNHELLPMPPKDDRPTVVVFLRHCGCPFAEKTLLTLIALAPSHPSTSFILISHSTAPDTTEWLASLPLPSSASSHPSPSLPPNLTILPSPTRTLHALYGLSTPSSLWHVLSPSSLSAVWKLTTTENIRNRPTKSGSRWQKAGWFGVSGRGVVVWGGEAGGAGIVEPLDVGGWEGGVEELERVEREEKTKE